MKKAFVSGMLLLLCLALTACSAGTQEPAAETETPEPIVSDSVLRISELMASNKASVPIDGRFPDWAELYNPGEETETLDGKLLRCGKKSMLLSGSLAPGCYALIPCEGMTLPREGAELRLLDWNGAPIDSVAYESAPEDQSLVRNDDGSLAVCRWPSPGQENSAAGYAAFQETLTGAELVIGEVMVFNDRFRGGDGAFHDWVELKNVSDKPLSLRDYHLSEKTSEWGLWPLPDLTLEPGGIAVLYSEVPDSLEDIPSDVQNKYNSMYEDLAKRFIDVIQQFRTTYTEAKRRYDQYGDNLGYSELEGMTEENSAEMLANAGSDCLFPEYSDALKT